MLSFCKKKEPVEKKKQFHFHLKIIVFCHQASLDELEIHQTLTGAADVPEKWTQKVKDAATFNSLFNLSEILQMIF